MPARPRPPAARTRRPGLSSTSFSSNRSNSVAATQLNMADRIAVRKNIVDRCAAIVANYALYILGGGGNQTDPYLDWARQAIRSPMTFGESVSWHVLNQADFLDHGSGIEDAT